MKLFLALLFFLISHQADACSCVDFTLDSKFQRSNSVAIVRVTSVSIKNFNKNGLNPIDDSESMRATAYVKEMLKGKKVGRLKITGVTPQSPCGQDLIVGKLYVFFWSGKTASYGGCHNQLPLSSVDKNVIRRWRSGP